MPSHNGELTFSRIYGPRRRNHQFRICCGDSRTLVQSHSLKRETVEFDSVDLWRRFFFRRGYDKPRTPSPAGICNEIRVSVGLKGKPRDRFIDWSSEQQTCK